MQVANAIKQPPARRWRCLGVAMADLSRRLFLFPAARQVAVSVAAVVVVVVAAASRAHSLPC